MADSESEVKKEVYVPPKVLVTYTRQELVEAVRPHGQVDGYTDHANIPG